MHMVLTSGLTFLAVLMLFFFGGEVLHDFALYLIIGIIVGTYSSICLMCGPYSARTAGLAFLVPWRLGRVI